MARPARQRAGIDRLGEPAPVATRHRSLGERRPEQRHDRGGRRGRDVQRPAVAPNVHRGAPGLRAKFVHAELAMKYNTGRLTPAPTHVRVIHAYVGAGLSRPGVDLVLCRIGNGARGHGIGGP
jgi:hypothetical protein